MNTENPITQAVKVVGTYTALARELDLTPQAVRKYERLWDAGNHRAVPAHRAVQIERATGVSRHCLRPDLWPTTPAEAA